MVQGLCKTPSHWEQGSRTLAHLLPKSTILPAGGTTSNLQVPQVLQRDPKKKHPQNSLGCRIINTSPAHAYCNLRAASGAQAHPMRLRSPVLPSEYKTEKRDSRGPTKIKNGSAAAARSPFPCFLPRSASWLPLTVAAAPAASAAFPRATQKSPLSRSLLPRETNQGFASAPPLPAARALPANQRSRCPPSPPPRGTDLSQD